MSFATLHGVVNVSVECAEMVISLSIIHSTIQFLLKHFIFRVAQNLITILSYSAFITTISINYNIVFSSSCSWHRVHRH